MSSPGDAQTREHYYNENVNFVELAEEDKEFGSLYNSCNGHLDWQDPVTVQTLTSALLKRDFNLIISLPEDRLCPPVPVRWNYVRWLQELLDTTTADYSDTFDPERTVTGLDIGTGASCIYALLACASRSNWRLLATDIDEYSLRYAVQNRGDNHLTERIKLKQTGPEDPLIPLDTAKIQSIDFVVCNPPFYSSEDDMKAAYYNKALPPSAICTGSTNEMIGAGGDLGFATRILEESLELRERVQWYSCMFSRLASAQEFVTKLKKNGITNYAATNLRAGQKTVRWAIAWSFTGLRPRNDVVRHGTLIAALLPQATERTVEVRDMPAAKLGSKLDDILTKLDLKWEYNSESLSGRMVAAANVWSRSAKRRRKLADQSQMAGQKDDEHVALAINMTCHENVIKMRWLCGEDPVVLGSFIGMLRTQLGIHTHET